jgi:hypothetical protein
MRVAARKCLYFHDLEAVSRILWLPGIDARIFIPIGHFVEGAPASLKSEFRPVCLGFGAFSGRGRRSGIWSLGGDFPQKACIFINNSHTL